mgnify:FL=1
MQNGSSPLFKQGMSAKVKLIIFAVMACALLLGDIRWEVLGHVRAVISTVLYPFQSIAVAPADFTDSIKDLLRTGDDMQEEIDALHAKALQDAPTLQKALLLEQENAQLRELIGLKKRMNIPTLAGEILYEVHNNFTNKVVINRGASDDVKVGQAVIDESGVIGQVSHVWLSTSEVTLLTDRSQAIPVLNTRTGERILAFGDGDSGYLELRFLTAMSDIQEGDRFITSGIDGVYPAGMDVAVVSSIIAATDQEDRRVLCAPLGGVNRQKYVLILLTDIDDYPARPPVDSKKTKGEVQKKQEDVL